MEMCNNQSKFLIIILKIIVSFSLVNQSYAGYFKLHNLMSSAQKNIPNNFILSDKTLTLEYSEKGTGRVVNTQFANTGGMAGCGISSTLMQYMYQNASPNLGNNYIALNVYSQIMGFNPLAPFWDNPEGQVKGYLTQSTAPNNIAYPYTPYHRVIPGLYPAYLGLYNNGLNCGRWVQANFDTQFCNDRTTSTGISKFCPAVPLNYSGQVLQAYVFDSCEDNNGWCRDDEAHIDVDSAVINANYYLEWSFIKNPYYSNTNAPASLKDIWLAWFGEASPYWSYIAILNAENGVSNVQYNIGGIGSPTWINSHVLAGDNNVTWSSTSNNGQLWQIEPINSLIDSGPSSNPLYQIRLFDYLGYPANHGAIYQFNLFFADNTLGKVVDGYYFFYQGGSTVKSGSQAQNMTILPAPKGNGTLVINFNKLLPPEVSLDATQANYLRPVLISTDGYSWEPTTCTNTKCTYRNLPTSSSFFVFAHAINDVSNDLTLRKVNDVSIHSASISFPAGLKLISYTLVANDINLSTLYSARVQIPLQFTSTTSRSINANLQALFVPDNSKNASGNISAQTQGCFLNNYLNASPNPNLFNNTTTCTIFYTVNKQKNFSSASPSAFFNVVLPKAVGVSPVSYALTSAYNQPVKVTGYNPTQSTLPIAQTIPTASYTTSSSDARSLYLILDPQSDPECLKALASVNVNIGTTTPLTLTAAGVPLEIQIASSISLLSTSVKLSNNAISCEAMPAIVPNSSVPLQPGIDVVEVIKLTKVPVSAPPKAQGITAIVAGDAECLGGKDTLLFLANNNVVTSVLYTLSATPVELSVGAPLNTYTISDKPFDVVGGQCQLASSPSVVLVADTYVPVNLNYKFTSSPGTSCTVSVQEPASWPTGCNIQMTLNSNFPLSNITLSWPLIQGNWSNVQVWMGTLNIPATGNISWTLPSWINGQGSIVGMTVNNDTNPGICSAFNDQNNKIKVSCSGVIG
ncbi:hypothetical protein ACNVED_14950 (plasmid) [Legionella sp. D16C41]|uniref:hypothetical protein n=1 Tax=Legionella sp. D16C41 TaxID=3402688 RepID=UPI003AF63445